MFIRCHQQTLRSTIVRNVLKDIGYTNADYKFEAESCGVISTIHEQSDDIFSEDDIFTVGANLAGILSRISQYLYLLLILFQVYQRLVFQFDYQVKDFLLVFN